MIHRSIVLAACLGAGGLFLPCDAASPKGPQPGTGAASTPGAATGTFETGMFLASSDEGPGANYIANGRTTRSGVVTCPVNVPLPALPAGATVTATLIVWNYLSNSTPGADQIIVNGTAVTGTNVGIGSPDLCWGKEFGAAYAFGTAGTLPYVNIGGPNIVNNACNKALGADPAALGEGVTIIVTYHIPFAPDARMNIYWGYFSTESGPTSTIGTATLPLADVYTGGPFRMLVNGLDGQAAGDRFFVNGIDVSTAAGLGGANNAWAGFLGPAANSNFYDHANDNFAAVMAPGATTVTLTTTRTDVGDCIGHSLVALRFVTDNCPWDFDNNGVVGPSDLAVLLANWNTPFGPPDLAGLLAAWGPCPFSCPGTGSCSEPNGTPGCQNETCCEQVCAIDPFCCDVQWDALCANEAIDICFGCNADAGPCDEANGTPGCEVAWCCLAVCAVDPFCCDTEWDEICAGETIGLCYPAACSPTSGACDIANGSPGCDDPSCCSAVCAIDPFCCNTEWDELCAGETIGICYPAACGPNSGSCYAANDTPGCADASCCGQVCAIDPFCCDTEWDGVCANEAGDLCLGCGPGTGPCGQANGTPGCENIPCCIQICLADPFCCDTEWDQICANAANANCGLN